MTPVVNVKAWIGWSAIKSNTQYVSETAKDVLGMPKPQHDESFEEAITRLHLSPEDLQVRQRSFLRIALVAGLCGVLSLLYTLYMLWNLQIGGTILALIVSLIAFASAARYHFWYFQVKNRKLGCTWREWLDAKVSGDNQ